MKIVESKTCGKKDGHSLSEDEYCVTEHYACVIDGATDNATKRFGGHTLGQVISKQIKRSVTMLPRDAELGEIIKIINKNIINEYKQLGIYESIYNNELLPPTAAMALYSKSKHVVWMINDCQCMVDGKIYLNEKSVDDITAMARSLYLEAEIQKGKTVKELLEHDPSHEVVRPLLKKQYAMQNTMVHSQYSYVTITGFDFDLDLVKVIKIKADAEFLVLATDGYPVLRPTLEESESELSDILENDPLCIRQYKLAKGLRTGNDSFDDRTYIKIRLSPNKND